MSVRNRDAIGMITLLMTLGITTKVLPTQDRKSSNALKIVLRTKTAEHSNGRWISQTMVTIVVGGKKEHAKLNLSIH